MAQWEVIYEYGPHMSREVMIEADTQEAARERVLKRAQAFGHKYVDITSVRQVTTSLFDGAMALIVEGLTEANVIPLVTALSAISVSVKEIHNTSSVDHAYVFIIVPLGASREHVTTIIHQYNGGAPVR